MTPDPRRLLAGMSKALDEVLNGPAPEPPIIYGRQFGFALFVFELAKTDERPVYYASNSDRDDMIEAVREWLTSAEALGTVPTAISEDPQ